MPEAASAMDSDWPFLHGEIRARRKHIPVDRLWLEQSTTTPQSVSAGVT